MLWLSPAQACAASMLLSLLLQQNHASSLARIWSSNSGSFLTMK